jgi:hypothetical protein
MVFVSIRSDEGEKREERKEIQMEEMREIRMSEARHRATSGELRVGKFGAFQLFSTI